MKEKNKKAPTTVSQFLAKALGKAAGKCNALTCSMWLCFGDDLGFCEKISKNLTTSGARLPQDI